MRTVFALLCLAGATSPSTADASEDRPNILLIMADDLGFSDIGCYGGEIATPNLDKLAAGGLRFTQFYNTARCWPTRGALLTGYYAQQIRRDAVPGVPSGGRGARQPWAKLLPGRLRPLGYRSYHSGKWHVDGMPVAEGFDRSYYLKDQSRFFSPQLHWLDDKKLPPVKRGSGFYGTTEVADRAIGFLKEHAAGHEDKPFFTYLAFAAPHFPLHALPEDIAKYKGRYDKGWAAVRSERWRRMQRSGLLGGELSEVERDLGPPYHFPEHLKILGAGEVNRPLPWGQLTPEQQRFQATKMEIHAAMIDRMDREIGRVLRQIEAMGQLENTLVMFLSDNGCSAEIMVRGDGHDPEAAPGSASTYLCLGPGWSTTCNTPFRRHKTWVHEGGIATPLVVSWPKGIAARGEFRRAPGHVIDIVPTLLELAGGSPATRPSKLEERRREEAKVRMAGRSMARLFAEDGLGSHEFLWWLHEGNRAVRVGDWKLVAAKGESWELYDLKADRAEAKDLAKAKPEKAKELATLWEQKMEEFREVASADLPAKKKGVRK